MTVRDMVTLDDDSLEAVNDYYYEQHWSDGKPIIPPTQARVEAMLSRTDLAADVVLGVMGPSWREASVHHVAVNAVMAGCRPEYFPVVLAGIEAVLDPALNLVGTQATTNPAGVMLVVNGPLARELDINAGFNVFGQGWRANATIGRALRLCMINIGGGLPGISDMSPLGNPNKFGSCIAENEAQSPWEPLHVERGFTASASTVSAIACTAPQNIIVRDAGAESILRQIAGAMQYPGSNILHFIMEPVVVLGPHHAKHIAAGGFDKAAVKRFLWEHAKIDTARLEPIDRAAILRTKVPALRDQDGRTMAYATEGPDTMTVLVAGGDVGPHSAIMQTFNGTHVVTRAVRQRWAT